jgi:isoquinoline 1-oxidoreductase beta subunit
MTKPFGAQADTNRREFLTGAAGFTLLLAVAPDAFVGEALADAPLAPNVWLTIATDGTITIVSPVAEMGQGTFTTLAAVLADELDADWSRVTAVLPPEWNEKKFGNPQWNGLFNTTASLATRGYFKPMRIAGAQARRVLLDAVSAKWSVPVGELSTEPSVVVHKVTGRRIGYGEIAGFAKVPAELPAIDDKDLKNASQFRYIGKDLRRLELPSKVTGAARYGIDVQVPGMLYAAVLQSPYEGGTPAAIEDSAARAVPGVIAVIRLPAGVGVVGNSVEATQAGKKRLEVTWTQAPAAGHDSERALEDFARVARDKNRAGVKFAAVGDAAAAMTGAARIFRGEYRTRYTYHAQMEPMNATAAVSPDGKSAEIWVGTQNPSGLLNDVAKLLQTERSNITFHQHVIGGGYGRRGGPQDVVLDAVRLAKAVGSPVKVMWSREDDMATGKFRPMTAHHIEAGFDTTGKLIAWHHRVVAESVAGYRAGLTGTAPPPIDGIVMKARNTRSPTSWSSTSSKRVERGSPRCAGWVCTTMPSRSRASSTRWPRRSGRTRSRFASR